MNSDYHLLNSEKLDEPQEAEILTPPQSSDAECSSDDDRTSPSDKSTSKDPSPCDSSVWKAEANLVNYIEGIGFLAIAYALKEGGMAAIVAFIIVPIILWYMGTILTECLYDEDDLGARRRVRSGYQDFGDALVLSTVVILLLMLFSLM